MVKRKFQILGRVINLFNKGKNRSRGSPRSRRSSRTSRRSSRSTKYSRRYNPSKGEGKILRILTVFISLVLFFMVAGIILTVGVFAYYSRYLPNPETLLERSEDLSTKIYDRNGEPIFEVYGEKNRILVTVNNISPYVVPATLAAEDASFYQHQGYSLRGMARAFKNTIFGEGLQGGSTLTQQVVKNTLLTRDRTISRKIKEFILSLQLENNYTKEEIIQMYLNETPYGGQNYGVYTAAKAYFAKDPKDLSLAEAAYIAGLPQSPSYYSQFGTNPQAGIDRKDYVLSLMRTKGWVDKDGKRHFISDEDYEAAKEEELKFQAAAVSFEAPHFVYWAKSYLVDLFGKDVVEQGGLQVTTTLDLDLQNKAQDIIYEQIEANKTNLNAYNGSLVALNPQTGEVLAMVGSKGFFLDSEPEGCSSGAGTDNNCRFDPQVNITISERQPGSAIKPITYSTLLEQGYTASFPILDVPTEFEGSSPNQPYRPVNYDGIFRGPMSLRKSLGNSLNIPAVKALKLAGIDNMIDQAEEMGITTFTDRDRFGLALTLGGGETKLLELTNAFGVFAAKGVYRRASPILEVKDARGKLLYRHVDSGRPALSEEAAFLISDILSDDGARSAVFGPRSLLYIPEHRVAVKTGTTDDKRDNYAIGFTPEIAAGVWVGNNNNEKMNPYVASGISGATPIWREFMLTYLDGREPKDFEPPETVEKITIDELTGMLPFEDFSSRPEWFINSTEPTAVSDWYQRIEICKRDGRIADDNCREHGSTEIKTYVQISAALPEWQHSVDQWVYENYGTDSKYYPPQMVSRLKYEDDGDVKKKEDPVVEIVNIEDGDTIPMVFRLKVEVSSPNDVDKVNIYLNDEKITEDSSDPYGYNFNFDYSDIGKEVEFYVKGYDEDDRNGTDSVKVKIGGY